MESLYELDKDITILEYQLETADAIVSLSEKIGDKSDATNLALYGIMGFPEEVILSTESDDTRSIGKKAIDLIRKGFVKLNKMIRKAVVKMVSSITDKVKIAKDMSTNLILTMESLTAFDSNIRLDSNGFDKYFTAIYIMSNNKDLTLINAMQLEIMLNFDIDTFDDDILDISENKNSDILIKMKSKFSSDTKNKLESKNTRTRLIGTYKDTISMLVTEYSDDGKYIEKIYIHNETLYEEINLSVGTKESLGELMKTLEKKANNFKKLVDDEFSTVDNISDYYDKLSKELSDSENESDIRKLKSAIVLYKKTPSIAYAASMSMYRTLGNVGFLLKLIRNALIKR